MLSTRFSAPRVLSPSLIPSLFNPPVLVTYFSPLYLFSPSGLHIHVPPLHHPPFLSLCFLTLLQSSLFSVSLKSFLFLLVSRMYPGQGGFHSLTGKALSFWQCEGEHTHTHTSTLLPCDCSSGSRRWHCITFYFRRNFPLLFQTQTAAQFKQPNYRNWSDKWKVSWDSSVVLAFT